MEAMVMFQVADQVWRIKGGVGVVWKTVPAIQLKWDFENIHSLPPPKGSSSSSSAHPLKPRLHTIHDYINRREGGRGGWECIDIWWTYYAANQNSDDHFFDWSEFFSDYTL